MNYKTKRDTIAGGRAKWYRRWRRGRHPLRSRYRRRASRNRAIGFFVTFMILVVISVLSALSDP